MSTLTTLALFNTLRNRTEDEWLAECVRHHVTEDDKFLKLELTDLHEFCCSAEFELDGDSFSKCTVKYIDPDKEGGDDIHEEELEWLDDFPIVGDWGRALHFSVMEYGPYHAPKILWDGDKIRRISVDGIGMFIIPNPAATSDECFDPEKFDRQLESICQSNGLRFDRNEPMVEVWAHSYNPHWMCENLQDHHPTVKGEDGSIYELRFPSYIPLALAERLHEGMTTRVILPVEVWKYGTKLEEVKHQEVKHFRSEVILEVTPDQLHTRYRRYGRWEDCLSHLIFYRKTREVKKSS